MPDIPPSFHLRVQLDSLRSARREAEWVGQRLGAPALLGSAATEAEVRRRLPSTPIAHFATHGFAFTSDADVRKSFVALAPDERDDGLLTVGEIIDSLPRLHAELVVLSACETGLGDVRQAEGTVGLPRALLARGARSVIVSLWNVDDRATALLMQRFYVHWLDDADHPTKSRALERAQSDVRAVPRFASARYWGAFQIVGAP